MWVELFFTSKFYANSMRVEVFIIHLCTTWQIYSATAIGSVCVIALKAIMTVEAADLEAGADVNQ